MIAMDTFPRATLDRTRTTGLILCGMGGPDGPGAVAPFLRNLFRDPDILPVPRPVAGIVGPLIAWLRAPRVRRRYAMISDDSATPQLSTTMKQAACLGERISAAGPRTLPGVAMRYWNPLPERTVAELADAGARQFLVVPTYPQYSGATSGSTIRFVLDALEKTVPGAPVHVVPDWHLLPGFIDATARPVIDNLDLWAGGGADPGECALLYVAHSLPRSFIGRGDPYLEQTRETVTAAHGMVAEAMDRRGRRDWLERLAGGAEPALCFQSKVGPIAWLGPLVTAEVERLAGSGVRRLLVQPVSFTCEHIETLLELDIELKEQARNRGIHDFRRGSALNLDEVWLDSLAGHLMNEAFSPEEHSFGPEA